MICGIIFIMLKLGRMTDRLFRRATIDDIDLVTAVEAECFPAAEAAPREQFHDRLSVYPTHFWLCYEGDKIIGFIDGFVSDEEILTDEMFADAKLHNEAGAWQMIFGLNTLPQYRRQGYAGAMIEKLVEDARQQGRKGVILTCKERLIHYYAKFGFVDEGLSCSNHGGAVWHQMRIRF